MNTLEKTGRRLLRLPEAAERLAVGRTTLYDMIGSGELPTVKIGRSVRIAEEDLNAFIGGLPRSAAALNTEGGVHAEAA